MRGAGVVSGYAATSRLDMPGSIRYVHCTTASTQGGSVHLFIYEFDLAFQFRELLFDA